MCDDTGHTGRRSFLTGIAAAAAATAVAATGVQEAKAANAPYARSNKSGLARPRAISEGGRRPERGRARQRGQIVRRPGRGALAGAIGEARLGRIEWLHRSQARA
jgi:hypothetical protein